jgi:L,D-transpeptidase ErfK/SrfK
LARSRNIGAALALVFGLLAPLCAHAQSETPAREDLVGRLRVGSLNKEPIGALARRNNLSTPSVMAANWGIDEVIPETREEVLLPTAHVLPSGTRDGILINRAEYRLYYLKAGSVALTVPIGIGLPDKPTPLGNTSVVRKQKDPAWYPTPEARREHPDWPASVEPGITNPLGAYALYLGWPTYVIHGSTNDFGIGRPFTRGCVRLFADDIETLFNQVPVRTPVEVVDQPVKLGWHQGELFLEAHPDLAQLDELRINLSFTQKMAEDLREWISAAAAERTPDVDWEVVTATLERRSGIPTQISSPRSHKVNIFELNMVYRGVLGAKLPVQQGFAPGVKPAPKLSPQERLREELLKDPYNI